MTVDLGLGTATGGDGSDTLLAIERVTGSAYGDSLTGTAAAETLDGAPATTTSAAAAATTR